MNLIQDVLSAASTQPEQDHFARIKLADILPDPENFYETDGIEELAAAIDAFGLEQPLVVRPADESGKYRLTGGHRRRLALLTLYAKDPERWAEVDVKITSSMGALADQARLILMNRTTRKETEYENMMETVKTAEIAKEFKANGGKVEGKTRTAVAAALGISSAQAGKYQAIYKHLCPTLMQRYKAGTIGTQVAYELSSLPNRQQEEIAATYPVPTMEAVRKKKESVPETFPDWALPMAKEFVNRKWVRKLEYFSAAMLQALAKDPTGGTNLCGGITDTSAKGIRFYLGGQHVQYTWFRRNYLAMAEKYGGVTRAELQTAARVADMGPRLEVVHGIALEMEQRIDDLLDGSANDLDLDPVHTFPRIDGISMKLRQLSDCCPLHQCFGHLAYLGLRPLLRARLLPYQFASIPKKGQTALKRQVERWLRRKSLGIQHALKLDVKGAYEHTKQELVLAILQYEIPRAAWLLAVVRCLLAMSPNGGLLIGGYLEAWMFNLVASYILVRILGYVKTRRGVSVPLVVRSGSYMDDLVLMGRRWADIQSAARKITKWVKDMLHLTIKDSWVRVDFLSPAEEHRRRHLKGAAKGCPGLDMAGYVMHRTYTTVRPGIFKRARRQYMRAGTDLQRGHFIPLYRSYRLISYNGYFKGTKSRAAAEALNQQKLFKSAKWAVRAAAIKERSLAV